MLEDFNALENVAMPLIIRGVEKSESYKLASNMLRLFNLDHREGHYSNELSGGEQQRVAIARALAAEAKLGAFAIPLAVAVGAMGAAQLAIIAGTSYQSTSSSGAGAVSAPSAVNMGSRGSAVDVGNRAGSGELAYLRGARGCGSGPEDFIGSAFYGMKMRAAGGAVAGYTVGEQGPELFVPEVPGTIVPNDDIGMGQNVNVSFNVQAIDASSFNDALTVQRGNIIEIIREAANSSGEGFLESVDTQSLN